MRLRRQILWQWERNHATAKLLNSQNVADKYSEEEAICVQPGIPKAGNPCCLMFSVYEQIEGKSDAFSCVRTRSRPTILWRRMHMWESKTLDTYLRSKPSEQEERPGTSNCVPEGTCYAHLESCACRLCEGVCPTEARKYADYGHAERHAPTCMTLTVSPCFHSTVN